MEELKTALTQEQLAEEVKKLEAEEAADTSLTKVTNVAQQEAEGKAPKKLTKEEMKDQSLRDYMQGMAYIQAHLRNLSKRGGNRVFIAALQLPQPGMKVSLQTREEAALFGVAQRVLNAKFSLILYGIEEEATKLKQKQNEEKSNGKSADSTTDNAASASPGASSPESNPDRGSVEQNVQEERS